MTNSTAATKVFMIIKSSIHMSPTTPPSILISEPYVLLLSVIFFYSLAPLGSDLKKEERDLKQEREGGERNKTHDSSFWNHLDSPEVGA